MKRRVDVQLLSGTTKEWTLDSQDFKIVMRAVELFYLTSGDISQVGVQGKNHWSVPARNTVSLMIEAEFDMSSTLTVGFIDIAQAIYVDDDNFTVLEEVKEEPLLAPSSRRVGTELL